MRPTKIIGPIELYETEPLGSGSTGNVFKGKLTNPYYPNNIGSLSSIQLAVKVIPHNQRFENEVTQYLFESQKQALNTLVHPCIVKCYGIFQDGRNSYLATEYIKGGTLKQYMKQKGTNLVNKGKINDKQAINLFKKLFQGLSYLSSKGFVHRDLKPANIMIKEFTCNKTNEKIIHPVIIDFGFSQRVNCIWKPQMFYNVGSPSYMAPESYNFTKYSEKSDLWSLGVVLYEMISGESFDFSLKVDEFFNFTTEAIQKRLADKKSIFSVRCMKILKSILVVDQNHRLTANQVLNLIEKLESQLQAYSLIRKRNQQNSMKNSIPKVFQKSRDPVNKKNMFFDIKAMKSRERQRIRIPSFLDKTKKQEKVPTIQKILFQRSPRNLVNFFPKRQLQTIKKIKSQQFIKQAPALKEKINCSTVEIDPKIVEYEKNVFFRRNTHIMSLSSADTNTSSTGAIHNNTFKSPQVKTFNKIAFNYKSNTSISFNQYLSPGSNQVHKTQQFFVSTR